MKLADLRKLAIRRQFRIRFALRNGMECVVDQHGVARVPALNTVPDFDLEVELAAAKEFAIDTAPGKDPSIPRPVRRDELAAMTAVSPSMPAPVHEED
jgi:hypothetical protein